MIYIYIRGAPLSCSFGEHKLDRVSPPCDKNSEPAYFSPFHPWIETALPLFQKNPLPPLPLLVSPSLTSLPLGLVSCAYMITSTTLVFLDLHRWKSSNTSRYHFCFFGYCRKLLQMDGTMLFRERLFFHLETIIISEEILKYWILSLGMIMMMKKSTDYTDIFLQHKPWMPINSRVTARFQIIS